MGAKTIVVFLMVMVACSTAMSLTKNQEEFIANKLRNLLDTRRHGDDDPPPHGWGPDGEGPPGQDHPTGPPPTTEEPEEPEETAPEEPPSPGEALLGMVDEVQEMIEELREMIEAILEEAGGDGGPARRGLTNNRGKDKATLNDLKEMLAYLQKK